MEADEFKKEIEKLFPKKVCDWYRDPGRGEFLSLNYTDVGIEVKGSHTYIYMAGNSYRSKMSCEDGLAYIKEHIDLYNEF